MHSMLVSLHKRITGSEEFDSLGDFVEGHTSRVSHRNGRHQSDYNSPPKAKFSLIFDSQVQWLPVLAHEAAKEVQHQQHLFLSELPNEETTEAGNATMASTTEETSGSGENEGSATEGSSEGEEVRLEPDHSTNHELN